MQVLLPPGWPRPRGYANGVAACGRMVFVAGMIGWDADCRFRSFTMQGQARQALQNVVGSFNAAMTCVEVSALIEDQALVEIEVTAVVAQ